jgi:hypothetical protein
LQVDVRPGPDAAHVTVEETQPSGAAAADTHVQARVAQPGGAPLEVPLAPTAPGRFEGEFPLGGPGTYVVRAEEQRADGATASAEVGLPVAYAAEFRQVSADPRRMEQIARAGGGHLLTSPADAFADDLPPATSPLPLERWLLLLAALLLPIDVALRRLRISPLDVLDWLRHPRRLHLQLPRWGPLHEPAPPSWLPGRPARRRPPPAVTSSAREPVLSAHVTPGLARQSQDDMSEEDALAATLRWLAERRGTRGDAH